MERKEDIGRMHTAGLTIDFEYGELWRGLHRSNPLSFKRPFSFTVYQDRDKYMAEDWRGRVRYEDDDAREVIQPCVNALPDGGKIFIRSGTYTLSSFLYLRSNVWIVGEGKSTVLDFTEKEGFRSATSELHDVLVEGLYIKVPSGYRGFNLSGVTDMYNCTFRDLTIENKGKDLTGCGIWIQISTDTGRGWNNKFENLKIYWFGSGIALKTDGSHAWFNVNNFVDIMVYACVYGVTLDGLGAGEGFGLRGNHFRNVWIQAHSNTQVGFRLINGTDNGNNTFVDCRCIDEHPGSYKMYISDTYKYTVIIGGNLRLFPERFYDDGLKTIVIDFQGLYMKGLKNSGTATVTGDGTTTTFTVDIPHGLISDKVACKITLDRDGTIDKVYLVDTEPDGFYETIRVQVTYATAPASGEEVPIYWSAEVVE